MHVRPEDWARVKAVFEGALALDGDARAAYVADECRDETDVRRQVESLLASYAQAGSLLESPAVEMLNLVPAAGNARRVSPNFTLSVVKK